MNQNEGQPALILASGEDVPKNPLPVGKDTLLICADGGARLARLWGLQPAIIIGDQDSLDAETKDFWERRDVPFLKAPVHKDETDVELAVNYALELQVSSITLVGAWGSRLDHSLGNLELLYRLAQEGIANELITEHHRMSAISTNFQGTVRKGSYVSLLPLSSVVRGVRTNGLLYPLQGEDITKGTTFTISNVALGAEITVQVDGGVLLVVTEQ